MKKILLFVGAAALLFGCEAAAIKEVKATAYSNAGNGVTIGDVFDKGLQNASWTSETDEAGAGCSIGRTAAVWPKQRSPLRKMPNPAFGNRLRCQPAEIRPTMRFPSDWRF